MDIFRTVTQSVLGGQRTDNLPSGAETVERLLDRVQSSTLLDDRRDGCRAIKSLSRKYRLLVGAHGMDVLVQVLETDREDHEIVNYALESLVNITSTEVFDDKDCDEESAREVNDKVGEQFTEIFIKRKENVSLVISLLDEFDFKIRFPTMKLLSNLLSNRPKDLQDAILVTPSGVSKLMDMLSDTREVIRNDTLLLLTRLTQGNTNLQKIVVFENAYDHLFEIIQEENFSDGTVVVEDCIILMLNLLKNNPSNQTLFKEGAYIRKMTDFFNLESDDKNVTWSPQKIAIVHYMLKLLRTLVSPQNTALVVSSCQKKIHNCGLLECMSNLLLAVGVPADILTDTIVTVAEVIRGCHENQLFFSSVSAPSSPPRPVVVVLLMSMANEKQPFALRCAVLYCFQCLLYRNPSSQAQIVQTLLPHSADSTETTSGQLLCASLFSSDVVTNWFSAIALSHTLLDNTSQKEQLLRVQLSTGSGDKPVSLLQQCTSLLQAGKDPLTRLGVLQLLSTWLAHCPLAVTHLLNLTSVIPNLTAYLSASEHDEVELLCQGICAFLLGICVYFNDDSVQSFTREALLQLISNRIGTENFADKITAIVNSESYSRSAKYPQVNAKLVSDLVFDYEFTKLYKSLEGAVLQSVTQKMNGEANENGSNVEKYKIIIREQDEELKALKETLSERENYIKMLASTDNHSKNSFQVYGLENCSSNSSSPNLQSELQQQLNEAIYARDYYYYQMLEKDQFIQSQQTSSESNPELANLRKQLEDLQLILYKKDEELQKVRKESTDENAGSVSYAGSDQVQELHNLLEKKDAEILKLQQTSSLSMQGDETMKSELQKLQSEQEDLLLLLGDQETKIIDLKSRLRSYGEVLSDSDDDEQDLNTDSSILNNVKSSDLMSNLEDPDSELSLA